jgi:PAS domain S-box-containing protein
MPYLRPATRGRRNLLAVDLPSILTRTVQTLVAARDRPERFERVFEQSLLPVVLADQRERFVGANRPACLALGLGRSELLSRGTRDLVAPRGMPAYEYAWSALGAGGDVALDVLAVKRGDGAVLDVTVQAIPDALPGLRLGAFAPVGANVAELVRLSRREVELLQLAADGLSGPMIAEELVLSRATVRTHFDNVYEKLDVHDRAGAVAKAMRLGLIA